MDQRAQIVSHALCHFTIKLQQKNVLVLAILTNFNRALQLHSVSAAIPLA